MPEDSEILPEDSTHESLVNTLELRRRWLSDPRFLAPRHWVAEAFPNPRGSVDNQAWKNFCAEQEIYEFLTEEFINSLKGYLRGRIEALNFKNDRPMTFLEVGAGDGRLTHFISDLARGKLKRVTQFVATDDGSYGISPAYLVERLNYREAIRKYAQMMRQNHGKLIVLCSWMKANEDWTAVMREYGVEEYILIGVPDSISGTPATWGLPTEAEHHASLYIPAYEQEGYERLNLTRMGKVSGQVCKLDFRPGDQESVSETVAFRRRH